MSSQEKTNQKYKDAKEAAREAAKSAEMAQMAARAAAELARLENEARGKAQGEEDVDTMHHGGSVAEKQPETGNLDNHKYEALDDTQSDEEEEEESTIHAIDPDRGNEYDVFWNKHEHSSVAVFDHSESDMDDHSVNLLDNFPQPKKEEYASSDFYWREKADNKGHDRSESVFVEDGTKDSSSPLFVSSSAPTFDSDGLSSDDETESGFKANKEQPKYIHTLEREEKEEAVSSVGGNKRVSSDDSDDDDKPKIDLNFGKLTGGFKNKGYRRTPYVKKPIIDATSPTTSVETLDDPDIYVPSKSKNLQTPDVIEAKTSSVVSLERENGQRGSKKLASRFHMNYFDTEDEVEELANQQVQDIGKHTNKNIIKHSRRTRGTPNSEIRERENINSGEDRHPQSSDEEISNESVVVAKSGLEEDQAKSGASASGVRYRRPPDYDSLAAHFRSLRTNRP